MTKNLLLGWATIFCLFLQGMPVLGQGDPDNENDNVISMATENTNEILNMIYCDYEVELDFGQLKSLVSSFTYDSYDPCNPIFPSVSGATESSSSFEWDDGNADSYTVGYIGLSDGDTYVEETTKTEHTIHNMTAQQYMIFFIANCNDGSSLANIIIDDKDVFDVISGETIEFCQCYAKMFGVPKSEDCDYFTQFTFPWTNTCFGNKYRFMINNPGTINDRFFWVINTNPIATEVFQTVNILECSDGYDEEDSEIHEPGNFWVNFTSAGAHVYITNPLWTEASVSAAMCECYEYEPGNQQVKFALDQNSATQGYVAPLKLQVWPNPFTDKLQLISPQEFTIETTYSVMDSQGKIWLSERLSQPTRQLDIGLSLQGLPKGMYYLLIEDANTSRLEKIVKM